MRLKIVICCAEMAAPEKAVCRGIGRRVRGGENEMLFRVHDYPLLLRVFSPKQKHEMLFIVREFFYDGIGKLLPALVLMRTGCARADGQGSVQEEYSLLRPAFQIAVLWRGAADVIFDFFINVLERWRHGHLFGYGKTKPVRLPRAVIGVLT